MKRLEENGLEENREKRTEAVNNVKILGYNISKNSLKSDLDKAQGIRDYQRPRTKKTTSAFTRDAELRSNLYGKKNRKI